MAEPSENATLRPAVVAARNQSEWDYWLAMIVLTILAFATRFYRIDYPNEVVFDEVHFGKVSRTPGGTLLASGTHKKAGADAIRDLSLPPITSSACTSSTYTLPSASSCSPLWAG